MTRLLEAYARWVGRHALWVLVGMLTVTVLLATQLSGLNVNNDLQRFYPNDPLTQTFHTVSDNFGGDQFARTLFVRFTPRAQSSITGAQAVLEMERALLALRGVPGVASAKGLPDLVKLISAGLHGGDPAFARLPVDGDPLGYTFQQVIQLTLQRLSEVQDFLSVRGSALVVAQLTPQADILKTAALAQTALRPVRQSAQATHIEMMSYGSAIQTFNSTTLQDLQTLLPLALGLIALILAATFRIAQTGWWMLASLVALAFALSAGGPSILWGMASSAALGGCAIGLWQQMKARGQAPGTRFRAVAALGLIFLATGLLWSWTAGLLLLGFVTIVFGFGWLKEILMPLAVVITASIWTFGLMAMTGIPLNFLVLAIFPLLLGVGLDDALHLLVRFGQETRAGYDADASLQRSVVHTGRTLWFTTLSTIAGFSALVLSPSPPVNAFGWLATFAMLSAFFVTMTFIPATQHLTGISLKSPPKFAPWGKLHLPSIRPGFAWGWLALMVGVGVFAYASSQALKVYPYDLRWLLPQDNPQVTLYERINEEFKNYDQVQILLEGNVARLDVMRALVQTLTPALSTSPHVRRVRHIGRLLDDVRYSDPQADARFMAIFSDDPDVAYANLLEETARQPVLHSRLNSLVRRTPAGGYDSTVVRIDVLRAHTPESVAAITADLQRRLTSVRPALEALGLKVSMSGSPFLEALSLTALKQGFFDSIGWAFLLVGLVMVVLFRSLLWSLVCLLPMALMVALEVATIHWLEIRISASTALVAAIGIGLGVDYTIHLAQRMKEKQDVLTATRAVWRALLAATGTTLVAFAVLMAGQIPWNRDFGLLTATSIAYAFLVTLTVFPALLSVAKPLLFKQAVDTTVPIPATQQSKEPSNI